MLISRDKIRDRLRHSGISQAAICRETGLHPWTLCRFLQADPSPTEITAARIWAAIEAIEKARPNLDEARRGKRRKV